MFPSGPCTSLATHSREMVGWYINTIPKSLPHRLRLLLSQKAGPVEAKRKAGDDSTVPGDGNHFTRTMNDLTHIQRTAWIKREIGQTVRLYD